MDTTPEVETSCSEDTIAVLLGDVARRSPARAIQVALEHLEMRGAVEDGDAERAESGPVPAARSAGAAEAFAEACIYLRGILDALTANRAAS